VDIETKKIIMELVGIKACLQQGEGAVVIDYRGIIFHTSKNLKTQKMTSQITGMTDDWFNQQSNPVKALTELNCVLKQHSDNSQVISLSLPFNIQDGSQIFANILYYPEKQKYFILNSYYSEPSKQTRFVSFDKLNENAYFYSAGVNALIFVKGLELNEI